MQKILQNGEQAAQEMYVNFFDECGAPSLLASIAQFLPNLDKYHFDDIHRFEQSAL